MGYPKLDFLNIPEDNKIPVPDISHITSLKAPTTAKKDNTKLTKYEKEYDAFCRYMALPDELRKPKSIAAFERKFGIPASYTTYFKQRDDFRDKVKRYFWEWVRDMFPNIVQKMYKDAMKNGSSRAAQFFAELIAKDLETDKPQQILQPFVMIGVPQEKIDKLFTPKGFEHVEEAIPVEEKT